ncbi:hypothetical protein CEXT_96691 [Caerostris extrusa]|uniref:Uncharacterized protein n=1 Tax=Caerostris extrusa TaxID=172846 RepID=A0AAV4RJM4_CAEEX|nr:hypothetical protein CEXT_96691 [Caerostris extrusa]
MSAHYLLVTWQCLHRANSYPWRFCQHVEHSYKGIVDETIKKRLLPHVKEQLITYKDWNNYQQKLKVEHLAVARVSDNLIGRGHFQRPWKKKQPCAPRTPSPSLLPSPADPK